MMVHLASHHLSPNGYIVFNGTKNALYGLRQGSVLENIAKSTNMQMALNLSLNKYHEDIVWDNTCINTFICETLIQDRNIKMNPSVNHKKEWLDMKNVANMFKYWSIGENRPINGSYFGFVN